MDDKKVELLVDKKVSSELKMVASKVYYWAAEMVVSLVVLLVVTTVDSLVGLKVYWMAV